MANGYKVEYAWYKFPVDPLKRNRKYFRTDTEVLNFIENLINAGYYQFKVIAK